MYNIFIDIQNSYHLLINNFLRHLFSISFFNNPLAWLLSVLSNVKTDTFIVLLSFGVRRCFDRFGRKRVSRWRRRGLLHAEGNRPGVNRIWFRWGNPRRQRRRCGQGAGVRFSRRRPNKNRLLIFYEL